MKFQRQAMALCAGLFIIAPMTAHAQTWYDSAWSSRVKITIPSTQISSTLTDFPVYVDLSTLPAEFFTTVSTSGNDIVVTSSDGTTKLARELVGLSTTGSTGELWFKAPTLSDSSNNVFCIYYGNGGASEGNSSAVWSNGYAALWHFEESSGTHADASGNGNGATEVGSPNQGATGRLGGGISLTPNSDSFRANDDASLDITGTVTLQGWIYPTNLSAEIDQRIVQKRVGVNQSMYGMFADSNGTIECRIDSKYWNGSAGLSNNNWYHVAMTYDDSVNTVIVYVNGVQTSSNTSWTASLKTNNEQVDIGGVQSRNNRTFRGTMDEIRISSVVRSGAWLASEYTNQNTPASFYTVGSHEGIPVDVGPTTTGACGGEDCAFQSIQAAINSASAGDTITIYRRTDDANNSECYDEHLTISAANITLRGASTTSPPCLGPTTGGDILTITANGVRVENLHISGRVNNGAGGTNSSGSGGRESGHGIYISGDDVDGVVLQNVSVDNTFGDNVRWDGDQDNDGDGYVVIKQCYLHHADVLRNLRIIGGGGTVNDRHIIRNNLIHTGHGIMVSGNVDYITLEKNIIKGWPFWEHLDLPAYASFPLVRDGSHGGGWKWYSNCAAGIWITAATPADLVIQNNLIIGARVGVRINATGTVLNNTIVNPFNTATYDYTGTAAASDIRDETFGLMLASGFSGTVQNNVISVTDDNRANGLPGSGSAPYYTPGISGYGIAFEDNTGTLGGGANISNNNVHGFVDVDGKTELNYGDGITEDDTNLSFDPEFASDNSDETNGGGGSCDADPVDQVRCFELYEDNFFLSSSGSSGSCHANIVPNAAGSPAFVDLSGGGTKDPDTGAFNGMGDCNPTSDAKNSRAIDFGTGSVGNEGGGGAGQPNLGAFGGTDRASESPSLRIASISVGDRAVKNGAGGADGPGLIYPGDSGIDVLNIYFNRAVTLGSRSLVVRRISTTEVLTNYTLSTSKAGKPPFAAQLSWQKSDAIVNDGISVTVHGDGIDRVVDSQTLEALDGEFSDPSTGTVPSGDGTAGGDAILIVHSLVGDADGDGVVESGVGEDDYLAINALLGACKNCPEDIDGDNTVDAGDLALATANDNAAATDTSHWLLVDCFHRSNNTSLGGGWVETESSGEAEISGNLLSFDSANTGYDPMITHAFTQQTTGTLTWKYTFHMERTGSEGDFEVRMQLGDGALMDSTPASATEASTGVAANLIWASSNRGPSAHEGFGYADGTSVTQIGVVSGDAGSNSGGDAVVTVTLDLDANTYSIAITGSGLVSGTGSATGIPFDNNVDPDTVRIYFDDLSDSNFGDLHIDDMSVIKN